ncbi:MAG: hypothetical protein IJL91_05500 [Bacteroidales bacterium]|nr:hypothetical protein [Bacteroidales bacterium]
MRSNTENTQPLRVYELKNVNLEPGRSSKIGKEVVSELERRLWQKFTRQSISILKDRLNSMADFLRQRNPKALPVEVFVVEGWNHEEQVFDHCQIVVRDYRDRRVAYANFVEITQ